VFPSRRGITPVFGYTAPHPSGRGTSTLRIKTLPSTHYVGSDSVLLYVGIRADENRTAYVSSKPNIKALYPFVEDGITVADVFRILEESGLGLPSYYSWRTRSGCYFCFFQRRAEWVGLLEHHPDLFEKAKEYEKIETVLGDRYTWSQRESLEELARPERVAEIKRSHEQKMQKQQERRRMSLPLLEVLNEVYEGENDDEPCFFCQT